MVVQTIDKRGNNGPDIPGPDRAVIAEQYLAVLSAVSTRASIAATLGKSFANDARDLYTALGYEKTPTFTDSLKRYIRQDIAKRIINLPIKACWRKKPKLTESQDKETAFERDWEALVKERRVWHYLSRVDRAASLGRFAVLLIGFDDGLELEQEVTSAGEVLYLMPYMEDAVTIPEWVSDSKSPRYGLPESYSITIASEGGATGSSTGVHWSRVLHVAEDMLSSNVYGTPALEAILNRLEDLDRIAGGSGEMFWRGAFPGLALNVEKGASVGVQDEDALATEIDNYIHGMKRTLRLEGIIPEQLAPQVADPSNHVQVQIDLIAATRGIPKRILMGSERGELASTQDEVAFAEEMDARRTDHCEPVILRPFVDRLIDVGVLSPSQEEYVVEWPDMLVKSDKDLAEVGRTKAATLKEYVSAPGADMVVPPEVFLEEMLGFDRDMIEKIADMLQDMLKDADGDGEEADEGELEEELEDEGEE